MVGMGYNSETIVMVVFLWIWKIIGPIVFFVGLAGLVLDDSPIDCSLACILGAICTVAGIVIGFTGWAEQVPPRMFWVKGKVDLLDNKVGYALALGVQMFFLPAAVMVVLSYL